ncbi:MAG: GAF domain-containing protein, partial [Verrucomicrobiota bacterium]
MSVAISSHKTVKRYQGLPSVARCFGAATDVNTLIDEILGRASEMMNAEGCTLLLPDPKTGELILHSTDPSVANLPEPLRVPPGAGIAGAVYQSKQILNVKDVQNDPRHYSAIASKLGKVTRAMLTIPLLNGASCLGVLQALNPREQESFNSEDEEILVGFGGLIVNAPVRIESRRREIEQAQSQQQLFLAREIQDTFLPPPINHFKFCEVYHQHLPAQTVSGDFGFIHPISGNRLLLGLSDVSGKGFPAALTMARATAVIQAMTDQLHDDLGEWLT